MLQKSVRSAALFLVLLSIGCSRNGDVENPDDGIRVTTLEAIHGRVGHLIEVTIGNKNNPVVDRVVLRIHDRDISDAVLYISLAHTIVNPDRTTELIAFLRDATDISLVPVLPEGVKQRGGIILGDKSNPPFWIYLKVTTPTDTKYWSVRGNLWLDRRDWFLTAVRKPPEIIDTKPARVVSIDYYLDEALTQPLTDVVMVSDTVYTKVVFSKDIPITLANDSRARPHISSSTRSQTFQYRMKPRGTVLESGDARPYQDSDRVFVGMYRVSAHDYRGEFHTSAGHPAVTGSSLQIKVYRYDADDIPSNTGTTIVDWHPTDFVGQVYTMLSPRGDNSIDRSISTPLPGVTVTITVGPRAGESTVTDLNGRYRFLNIPGDFLYLRTDRPRYEPKEVIVYRSQPTALADGSVPNYRKDPQRQPGNILIGHVWPYEVRFILEETLLPYDLLYIEYGTSDVGFGGWYNSGLVGLYQELVGSPQSFLGAVAHELAHAHQHAIISVDGSRNSSDAIRQLWPDSPEGRAYAAARAKDWAEVGETIPDQNPYYRNNLYEAAAETASYYWGVNRWVIEAVWGNEKETAPNRYRWAAEWLPKK